MNQLLLCTDLDRTLLPNGPQPESANARKCFRSLVTKDNVTLVYVTGRHKALVKEAIDNYNLPQPDYVIADVGSTIYKLEGNDWSHWEQWESEISSQWQGKRREDLHAILKTNKNLRLQEHSKQNIHKLSYYVPLYVRHEALIKHVNEILSSQNIRANLVWSIDESANIGLLDILPANANKQHAITFLMQKLNYSIDETVFAGDSGNDIAVMVSPIHSVLVANASDDVKRTAIFEAEKHDELKSLYIAQGNYLNMNGNYSAGILEGIVHYFPEVNNWVNC